MKIKVKATKNKGKSPRTVRQFAEELNLSQPTVRAWLAGRKISYVRLGRSIRIPAWEIDRLLSEGMVPSLEAR
jgi:excisionase family DNA binding protein